MYETLTRDENHIICEPDPKRFYSLGVDLARFRDHTTSRRLTTAATRRKATELRLSAAESEQAMRAAYKQGVTDGNKAKGA